jgi:hypothetical protein
MSGVLMFERSGFSIAMGNASDEVKARAHVTTDSYNDEGFAKAIERFIVKPPRRDATEACKGAQESCSRPRTGPLVR